MKRLLCLTLAILLLVSLTACGGEKKAAKVPDMQAVYAKMAQSLPADAAQPFDSEYVFNAYGVKPEDCKQQAVTSYYDGAVTAEIWLIEAVSNEAAQRIHGLAKDRMLSMCEQFQSYDPQAYAVAKNAKLYTEGNCVVLLAADNVDALWDIYRAG